MGHKTLTPSISKVSLYTKIVQEEHN